MNWLLIDAALIRLEKRLVEWLGKCGGPGSGIPGPCPGGGNNSSTDVDKPDSSATIASMDTQQQRVTSLVPDYLKIEWSTWANGTRVGTITHPSTRRGHGVVKIKPDGAVELNDSAKETFGDTLQPIAGKPSADVPAPTEQKPVEASKFSGSKINGGWTTTRAGSRVAVVSAEDVGLRITRSGKVSSSNFGSVKEGDEIEVDGQKFKVHSIGSPFKTKDGETLVYLYPDAPKKRAPQSAGRDEPPDDPMERMEWEQNRRGHAESERFG